ncbi:hypothetical protein BSK64_27305 [Paenibacillus odorifer]|uniref:hypothetical protein n=1 Tax=Paenibacillus odorifer TaxID=189426 RepID=UPI00096C26A8|nr:hypothetical protein [Paenibacillus odorifer]OMD98613.1 hypothetical protein BSK64_27305 [Paenibacillus odorifer]
MSKTYSLYFKLVLNLPSAAAMSLAASLMNEGINGRTWVFTLVGFSLACLINDFIPLMRISDWFTGLFALKKDLLAGQCVGCLLINFIPVTVISGVMALLGTSNLSGFLTSFTGNYPVLYLVSYLMTMIMTPLAKAAGNKACTRVTVR